MGKDTKGHGSNPRGGDTFSTIQIARARDAAKQKFDFHSQGMKEAKRASRTAPSPETQDAAEARYEHHAAQVAKLKAETHPKVLKYGSEGGAKSSPTGRAAAPINRRGDTFKPKGSK